MPYARTHHRTAGYGRKHRGDGTTGSKRRDEKEIGSLFNPLYRAIIWNRSN
jgi:hypothetical protein